jgi:LacI family transcriptional regulator
MGAMSPWSKRADIGGAGKRPTMNDVARAAGVALSTVSRVVNQDPTVGSEIAARVNAAIADAGYQPDERAQQLRRGNSGMLGAAIRQITGTGGIVSEFQRAAREHKLMVITAATEDDVELERSVVTAMTRRRVDGLLFEPIGDHHGYLAAEIRAGLPVVAVDRPAEGIDVDCVVSDNRGGIELAYQHLVAHGHRRIAYIGDDERIFTGRARAEAFRACVRGSGERLEGMVHPGEITAARIAAAVTSALGGRWPATAIISGNELTTMELLVYLGTRSQQVAVVAFDDVAMAGLLRPALTVITQGHQLIARTAFDLLIARMAQPHRATAHIEVPITLIERGSGELPPGR